MNARDKEECSNLVYILERLNGEVFPEDECLVTRQCIIRIVDSINDAVENDEDVPMLKIVRHIITFMGKMEMSFHGHFDEELIAHGMTPRKR